MKDTMTYKEFIGTVHYSAEDKVFFGKVEGVNAVITFEGETVQELEEGFKYMIDEHIKDCEVKGIPVEKSYKGSLNIRLTPELHKKASRSAIFKGVSLNQLINNALENYVSK